MCYIFVSIYLYPKKKDCYGFLKKSLCIHCSEHHLWFMALWNTMKRSMFTLDSKMCSSNLLCPCCTIEKRRVYRGWKLTNVSDKGNLCYDKFPVVSIIPTFNGSIPIFHGQNPYEVPCFLMWLTVHPNLQWINPIFALWNHLVNDHISLTWKVRLVWDSYPWTKTGWWLTYPSEKYEFVSWDDDIPNWMKSHNPVMFQTTRSPSHSHCWFIAY